MIRQIDAKEYEQFVISKRQDHFLHSVEWAKAREKINWTYDIIGFKTPLEGAALIMYKKFPYVNKYYAYISRGFVIDYTDKELLNEFTNELKKYLKTKKVSSLTIDPDVVLNNLDAEYNITSQGENADLIFSNLKEVGYIHQGFYNNFEGIQPRHTFRINFQNKEYSEVVGQISKSTKKNINLCNKLLKSGDLEYKINEENAVEIFFNLMEQTTKRDGFTSRDINYYKNIMKEFGNNIQIINVYTNPKKMYKDKQEMLKVSTANLQEIIQDKTYEELSKKAKTKYNETKAKVETLTKEIEALEEYKTLQRKDLASAFLLIHNKKAWYVYGASSDDLRRYRPTYLAYDIMIKYCYEQEVEFLDLFGVGGTLNKDDHIYGLYQVKKGFGGDLIEFIGEYDLVVNRFYYTIYKTIFPKLKKIRKSLNR